MEYKKACPKCGIKLPIFTAEEKHNFCPSNEAFPSRIMEICMKCKIEEVIEEWKKAERR